MFDMLSNITDSDISFCAFCDQLPWRVFNIVFGAVIFFYNMFTLRALVKCNRLKMSLKYCFTNLALTDSLSGFMYVYHSVGHSVSSHNTVECKIRYWFVSMASSVTLFTLNMLSVDRLLALELPLKYERHATKKVLIIFTVVCWLIAAIFVTSSVAIYRDISVCSFVQLMTTAGYISLAWGCFFLTASIICCHIRIFILARRQIAKILPTMLQEDQAAVAMKLNLKATVTTALVLVPFCLLNVPMFTYFACLAGEGHLRSRDNALDIMDILLFLQICNSLINPIIYAWRLPELRHYLRVKFPCCKNKPLTNSSSSGETTQSTTVKY